MLSSKLLISLFIVVALFYILNNNTDIIPNEGSLVVENSQALDDEVVLDNVHNEYTKQNEQTASTEASDPISAWDTEFSYKDVNADQVQSTGETTTTYADFTSDGKNYYNNLTHFDSADLLPKPDSERTQYPSEDGWTYKHGANWDESNPQIKQVEGNAWLNERKFLGMYSVASTLRNATHDLRRDIPNPQMTVGPWNNTTILPDSNSKGLCTL